MPVVIHDFEVLPTAAPAANAAGPGNGKQASVVAARAALERAMRLRDRRHARLHG